MAKPPQISDAEWEVMNVLWARSPLSANEVVEEIAPRMKWSPHTVKTLLNRLVKKGALGFETEGKRYLYRPRVSRDVCVRHESRSFVRRVFGGDGGALLCRFVDEMDLSAAEIAELKRAIENKGKQR